MKTKQKPDYKKAFNILFQPLKKEKKKMKKETQTLKVSSYIDKLLATREKKNIEIKNTWIIYWKGEYRHFEFGNEKLNDEEMLENVYEQFYK